jgi:hypothetical protein
MVGDLGNPPQPIVGTRIKLISGLILQTEPEALQLVEGKVEVIASIWTRTVVSISRANAG